MTNIHLLLFGDESDCHSQITKGRSPRNSFMDEPSDIHEV